MINITFTLSLPSISNTFHAKDTFVQINKDFSETCCKLNCEIFAMVVIYSFGIRTLISHKHKLPTQSCFEIEHEVNSKMVY